MSASKISPHNKLLKSPRLLVSLFLLLIVPPESKMRCNTIYLQLRKLSIKKTILLHKEDLSLPYSSLARGERQLV